MRILKTKEDILSLMPGDKFILNNINGGVAVCELRCSSISGRFYIRTTQSKSSYKFDHLYLYSYGTTLYKKQTLAEVVESKKYYFAL